MAKEKPVEIDCGLFYGKPLIFRPNSHKYFFDGRPIPSVTTILGIISKPLLQQWAADMAVKMVAEIAKETEGGFYVIHPERLAACAKAHVMRRDEGADVGRFLHKHAEAVLSGERPLVPTTEQEQNGVKGFTRWLKENRVEPIAIECRIVSEKYHYAGTTDLHARINGKIGVLDFKSGKAIYDEAWYQTEGYTLALEEAGTNQPPQSKHIIRLGKETGEFEAVERSISEVDRAPFLAAVALDAAIRRRKEHEKEQKKTQKSLPLEEGEAA